MKRSRYPSKLILDTSVLIKWWRHCRRGRRLAEVREAEVAEWAAQLASCHQTDAIVTPVYIEMIGGTVDRRELDLTIVFLNSFRCIDERRVSAVDWEEAIRLAQRVLRQSRPRDFGDCLIRAIAKRLKHEVLTFDKGFAW